MVQQEKGDRPLRIQKKAHSSFEISELRIKSNLIATSAESMILIWNYDNFQLRGVCFYQRSEIRRFEFLEDHLVIISVDAKGYLIIWDLRASRTFNYYKPFVKIHLKPESGANLLVNNMLVFKIEKERLLDQSFNLKDENFVKFYRRYQTGVRRSSSLINVHSLESRKVEVKKEVVLVYLWTENGKVYCWDLNIILKSMELDKCKLKEKPIDAFKKYYSLKNDWLNNKEEMFKVLSKISNGTVEAPYL